MIGGAGGTLATMLTRRGIRVTLVDINPMAFDIARLYFHMPAAVECHVGDGAAFLGQTPARYDAIVLDAFSEEKIPRHFLKAAFFRLVKLRLKQGGIFLINVTVLDDEDPVPDGICWALKTAWRKVRLLDSDGYVNRNAIAMAGAVQDLARPRLRMKPTSGARTLAKRAFPAHFPSATRILTANSCAWHRAAIHARALANDGRGPHLPFNKKRRGSCFPCRHSTHWFSLEFSV